MACSASPPTPTAWPSDLAPLDWPETKQKQIDWIGRSEGTEIDFGVEGHAGAFAVFTTRPDTLYGCTYMVLAPEHPLVAELTERSQRAAVDAYVAETARKSDFDRTELAKTKTGVDTGAFAIHPLNGARVPIWIADYVLGSYGTGAVMAVPAHDERDFAFAQQYGLPDRRGRQPRRQARTASSTRPCRRRRSRSPRGLSRACLRARCKAKITDRSSRSAQARGA